MTARDRILLLVVGGVALLGGFWFLALRRRSATRPRPLDGADRHGAAAPADCPGGRRRRGGREGAATRRDYAAVAPLGKAVPADDETATLLYQLQSAARGSKVDMRTFELGTAATRRRTRRPPARPAARLERELLDARRRDAAAGAPTLPPGASVGAAGFPTMPVRVHVRRARSPTWSTCSRPCSASCASTAAPSNVNGRLLTIDGISLVPQDTTHVTATIAATAFVLPASASTTSSSTGTAPSDQTASASIDAQHDLRHRGGPMKQLRDLISDIVDRRLWPVALGLVVALVAVPVVLGRGGDTRPRDARCRAPRRPTPAPPARPRRPR